MNLPEYSLRSAKVIWFFLAVLLAGGALGFATLGKKEDAVFVIKSASLVCSYPGATPQQVEELVTEPIEREVQSMRRVHKITSESYYGLSKIQVELDPATPASDSSLLRLAQQGVVYGDGRRGFDTGNGPWHDARVMTAPDPENFRGQGVQIHALLLLGNGRRRLERCPEGQGHPVGDAAQNTAAVIG